MARLLVRNQVLGQTSCVVPDELTWSAGMPADAHPSNWIPQVDGRPRACGDSKRLDVGMGDLWCLRPHGHAGEHW